MDCDTAGWFVRLADQCCRRKCRHQKNFSTVLLPNVRLPRSEVVDLFSNHCVT